MKNLSIILTLSILLYGCNNPESGKEGSEEKEQVKADQYKNNDLSSCQPIQISDSFDVKIYRDENCKVIKWHDPLPDSNYRNEYYNGDELIAVETMIDGKRMVYPVSFDETKIEMYKIVAGKELCEMIAPFSTTHQGKMGYKSLTTYYEEDTTNFKKVVREIFLKYHSKELTNAEMKNIMQYIGNNSL